MNLSFSNTIRNLCKRYFNFFANLCAFAWIQNYFVPTIYLYFHPERQTVWKTIEFPAQGKRTQVSDTLGTHLRGRFALKGQKPETTLPIHIAFAPSGRHPVCHPTQGDVPFGHLPWAWCCCPVGATLSDKKIIISMRTHYVVFGLLTQRRKDSQSFFRMAISISQPSTLISQP